MAGDWIKMRGNLWDDPRVARLCDLTDSSEGPVIGALYWLWATADQHTEDGFMPGLTLRQIDRKTGLQGFGAALIAIGWLEEREGGVRIVKFEEHNGQSAKRRCTDAQRKASVRNVSADDADKKRTSAELEEEKRREEEEKERIERAKKAAAYAEAELRARLEAQGHKPTPAGSVCKAMREVGFTSTNPGDPRLMALLEQGATQAEFVGIAEEAVKSSKGWGWLLKVVEARRADAAALKLAPPIDGGSGEWHETKGGVEAMALKCGLQKWDGICAWASYKASILEAAKVSA